MQGFALYSSVPEVGTDSLNQIGTALAKQQVQLAAAWQRVPLGVQVVGSRAEVPAGYVPSEVLQVLDDPDALAYHSVEPDGTPYISIGWGVIKGNGGAILIGANSLAACVGHEFAEAAIDPYCADYWDLPDGSGEIPKEVCDSTEGDVYEIDGVSVPNFLWPRYFSSEQGQQYDQMHLCARPGELRRGGYYVLRVGGPGGSSTPKFGALAHEGGMPAWKRLAKLLRGSRASIWRGAHPAWRRP